MSSPPDNFPTMNPFSSRYPIGFPGQPWGPEETRRWRAAQWHQRRYATDVLPVIARLRPHFDVLSYGEVVYGEERFPLFAVASRDWRPEGPVALVTGGVHGYETSGVHGALRFLQHHASACQGRVNLLVVPCVSPWAYERVQRWNSDAIDPNRSFRNPSPAQESAALMRLIEPFKGQITAHIDLHETTDSDESEFRPAKAARDGEPFEPCAIPDGFYLVDDTENPQPAFQQAIVDAVSKVTHIAPADAQGNLIGSPLVAPGVIRYAVKALGLCSGISGARYTTTTEVYPDSPRTSPEQCVRAQVTAVCAALDFIAPMH
ncbi:MAG: M14 family metallocarboxypeptidase [Marinagarivorans sp.]|nr:M14 family metallocarboxypeptidase [Marinagarivorans sp.]